jgi:hypothetical protein
MLEGLSQSCEMRWRVSAPSETDLTQVVCKVVSGPVVPLDSQLLKAWIWHQRTSQSYTFPLRSFVGQ